MLTTSEVVENVLINHTQPFPLTEHLLDQTYTTRTWYNAIGVERIVPNQRCWVESPLSPGTLSQSVFNLVHVQLAERLVGDICGFVRLATAPFRVRLLHQPFPHVRTGVVVQCTLWNRREQTDSLSRNMACIHRLYSTFKDIIADVNLCILTSFIWCGRGLNPQPRAYSYRQFLYTLDLLSFPVA